MRVYKLTLFKSIQAFWILIACTISLTGQSNIEIFDKYIQASMPEWKTPGMSVTIVKNKEVIFKKGYGYRNIDTRLPFTTNTVSFCASTTKAMTAVCMAMLVDAGKVKWDDHVHEILSDFELADPLLTKELTVKDLFTHNGGLGNGDGLWVYGYSSKEIMRRMRYMKPAYSLRSSFIYQNLMYVVAGEVIEKVSGNSWHEMMYERLFKPLNMSHTYTLMDDAEIEMDAVTPHWWYGDTMVKSIPILSYGGYDPAGSVVSTANDMAKWMQFWQDSGKVNGKRLLSAESYKEILKPQSFVTPSEFYPTQSKTNPHWMTYGLGWFQQDYRGKMIQYHTGSLDGVIAIHGFVPDENFSIYIFANMDHSEIRHALLWKAMDLWLFNDTQRDWSKELFTLYKKRREGFRKAEAEKISKRVLNTKPSKELNNYAGKFENELYGSLEIKEKDGMLRYDLPNTIQGTLKHFHYDIFRGKYDNPWFDESTLQFFMNGEGKVNELDLDGVRYRRQ